MGKSIFKNKIYIILFVISCVCAALLIFRGVERQNMEDNKVLNLNKGWYYIENGEKVSVTLPADIEYHETDSLILYNDTLTKSSSSKYLRTTGVQHDTRIYAGGKELYQFNDRGLKRNPTVLNNIICLVELTDDIDKTGLNMVFQNTANGSYTVHEVMVGGWTEIMSSLFLENIVSLFMTYSMIVLGILSMGLAIIMHRFDLDGKRLVYASLFLIVCGLWCLTDSSFMQLLANYGRGVVYTNFYLFMLILVPMIHYLKMTGDMNRYKFFTVFLYLCYLNIIVQSVLVYSKTFEFFEMLPATHFIFVAGVLISVILSVHEYKKSSDKDLAVCIRAFITEGIVGVITIICYIFKFNAYQNMFQIGILLFVLILLYSLGKEMVHSMKYRTEVEAYRRMAEEDKMTGLKNRRAYDVMIQSMEENRRQCKNALMIFADLNGLKAVNDNFGHNDGDELITAAAHCIEKAYSELGDCYRVGGDEFCVIIFNPEYDEGVMQKKLEEEIVKYNQLHPEKHILSIAYGSSYLCDEKGKRKSVSIWRDEADQKMYLDKKRQKAGRK